LDLDRLSDEELLEEFTRGREIAYQTLMRRHEDRIFSLAYRMTGDRSDALEATQDTFISAFRQAHRFLGEASFGTWLYRIGINACRDLLRKRRRLPEPVADPSEQVRTVNSESDEVEAVAKRVDLARALESLPEEYRRAVALHDLGGFPYEEIASIAQVPIGTVKSRISRGRRMLAEFLEQAGEDATSKETE
jgi:RNA polymerase sigma-70 factor, ECF subfamily